MADVPDPHCQQPARASRQDGDRAGRLGEYGLDVGAEEGAFARAGRVAAPSTMRSAVGGGAEQRALDVRGLEHLGADRDAGARRALRGRSRASPRPRRSSRPRLRRRGCGRRYANDDSIDVQGRDDAADARGVHHARARPRRVRSALSRIGRRMRGAPLLAPGRPGRWRSLGPLRTTSSGHGVAAAMARTYSPPSGWRRVASDAPSTSRS